MKWIILTLISIIVLSGCFEEKGYSEVPIATSIDNNGSSGILKQYMNSGEVSCGDVNAQFIASQEFMCEVWNRCDDIKEFEAFGCSDNEISRDKKEGK